jgi:hypothetical protein
MITFSLVWAGLEYLLVRGAHPVPFGFKLPKISGEFAQVVNLSEFISKVLLSSPNVALGHVKCRWKVYRRCWDTMIAKQT